MRMVSRREKTHHIQVLMSQYLSKRYRKTIKLYSTELWGLVNLGVNRAGLESCP